MTSSQYPQPYGDYVLLERLGVGGMSEVDLARKAVEEANFVRFVVIKRIKADRTADESFVRMFKDEARITCELHHNNIAHVYDFGRLGSEYYMALEYVPGVDLRRVINVLRERNQRVPLRIALRVLHDVCAALEYAHGKVDTFGHGMKIVHRDVNPRNIMISTRGEVKLIDFGVAKATNRLERTRTDHVKGKFAYMAPEQISGEDIDGRADIFAVGLTLHELITGYGPFYGLNQMQIMHRLMSGRMPELPVPPEIPNPGLLQMVHQRCLKQAAGDRYASAGALRKDLERVAEPLGGLATQRMMVEFLRHVEPELDERLRDKVQSYSGPLSGLTDKGAPQRVVHADPEGSMSGVTQTQTGMTRTGVLAGGMFLGMGVAVLTVVLVVVVGALALRAAGVWPTAPGTGGTAQEVAVDDEVPPEVDDEEGAKADVGDDDEAAVGDDDEVEAGDGESDGGSADTTAPDPVPSGTADVSPEPAPKTIVTVPRPSEDPDPVSAEPVKPDPVVSEPEPSGDADERADAPAPPAPAAVLEQAPPEDPPPEVAKVMGTLQVVSVPKGLAITVNGERTGHETPAMFEWPIGQWTVAVEGHDGQTVRVTKGMRKMVSFK